jgi:secondary thiamine-phosphate synthase enzyme
MFHEDSFSFETPGDGAVVDLSTELAEFLAAAPIDNGLCCIAVSGSTCGVTTIEHEPGLVRDLGELLQRLVPRGPDYHHDARWGDGNGFSHLRAALVGPSITFAVVEGKPRLGTWQQPVLLDFDNRPRRREVGFTIVGDQAPRRDR